MNNTNNEKIPKRINLNRIIRLGDKNLTVLEYLRDTEYPAELISIMADENCTISEALNIYKETRTVQSNY